MSLLICNGKKIWCFRYLKYFVFIVNSIWICQSVWTILSCKIFHVLIIYLHHAHAHIPTIIQSWTLTKKYTQTYIPVFMYQSTEWLLIKNLVSRHFVKHNHFPDHFHFAKPYISVRYIFCSGMSFPFLWDYLFIDIFSRSKNVKQKFTRWK